MLVIIYQTKTNPEKRAIWTLSDKVFPNIEASSVVQLLSTSFETTLINEMMSTGFSDWRGEEAQEIFQELIDKYKNIPR